MPISFSFRFKRFTLLLLYFGFTVSASAQPTDKAKTDPPKQTLRIELPRNSFDYTHSILPVQDSALLLITRKRAVDMGKNEIVFTKYNHKLKSVWETKAPQPNNTRLQFKAQENGRAYLLFNTSLSDTKLILYQIDTQTGAFKLSEHFLHSPYVTLREMQVLNGQIFFVGADKFELITLHLNPKEPEARILPVVMGTAKNLGEFRVDTLTKTLELLVTESQGINARIQTRFISTHGDIAGGHYITPKGMPIFGQYIWPARLTPGLASQKLLLGTYGYKSDEFVQGLYSINLKGEMRYFDFGKLKHFYEYKSSPAAALRMKARALQKEAKGNAPIKQYQIYLHQVLPHPQGYALIAEVLEPSSQVEFKKEVGPQGSTSIVGNLRRTFHVFACVFDHEGNLLWDNSFKTTHNKKMHSVFEAPHRQSIHKALTPEGNLIMAYMKKSEIYYKKLQPTTSTADKAPVQLTDASDKLVISSQEDMQHWYGTNFIAYGFQRIKSKKEGSRTVYYLQQVAFE